jgi:hypothetical protein
MSDPATAQHEQPFVVLICHRKPNGFAAIAATQDVVNGPGVLNPRLPWRALTFPKSFQAVKVSALKPDPYGTTAR